MKKLPVPILKHLGQKGFTNAELAREVGVSAAMISKLKEQALAGRDIVVVFGEDREPNAVAYRSPSEANYGPKFQYRRVRSIKQVPGARTRNY